MRRAPSSATSPALTDEAARHRISEAQATYTSGIRGLLPVADRLRERYLVRGDMYPGRYEPWDGACGQRVLGVRSRLPSRSGDAAVVFAAVCAAGPASSPA